MSRSASHQIRLLHVDDDPSFAALAAERLERADERFTVETVRSAAAALDRLAEGAPDDRSAVDCVVSDYEMPETDGIEFLQAVRERHPDLPFVLFTGRGSEEIASEAISAGVTDYVQKGASGDHYDLLANRVANAVAAARSRRALEAERDRMRAVFDALPDVGIVYDAEGRYRQVLTDREDLLVEPAARLRGKTVAEALPEPAAGTVADAIDRALATGAVQTVEYALELDGERTWFEARLSSFRSDGEDLVVFLARDVTDERARRERLEGYRHVVEEMGQAACIYDGDGRFEVVNDYLASWYGTTAEALRGEQSALVERVRGLEGPDADPFAELVAGERSVVRGEAEGDFEGRGHAVVSYQLTRLCVDGEFRGVVGVARDVTDERRRETAVEELHRATRDLFRASSREAVAERVADAVRDTLGYPINVVRLADDEGRLHPTAVTTKAATVLGERPVYDGGEPAWHAFHDGETLVVDDYRTVDDGHDRGEARSGLYVPLGAHGALCVATTTVGAFDEADVQLAEVLAANAEAALDRLARTRELERQNDRLAEFASVVSHDLRSPLSVVEGRIALARDEYEGPHPHLDAADRAVDRVQTLVDDLVTYAREGGAPGERESVDLAALARDCWATVDTGDARLRVETERHLRAHPGRLRQLLANLYRNAVEHAAPDVTVVVGDTSGGFYVADDGPGVPPDVRDSVFEFGYSDGGGSGLGLAIVEQVAAAHGWDVGLVESADGGARVEVTGVSEP